ncbi:PLP-dependent aminotransferase family protein [Rhodobacterales bacterium]|nr:PLP-dependent aminotransferase family protein [Rhodobacterales bacterium]
MKEPVFLEGVVTLDRTGQVPLAEQIYRGFRNAVRSGLLRSGTRLPATRRLAQSLGVGRNTVNVAYDLLQAEGIVVLRPGAAAQIADELSLEGEGAKPVAPPLVTGLSARGKRLSENLRGPGRSEQHIAFQPGAPALDCFPYEDWARCLRRAARLERGDTMLYRHYAGIPALRRQLVDHLAIERGVRATPDQILITSSMQASLFLLAQALADPGDEAWLEEPGYIGARTAFHTAGLTIRPMAVDRDGADPKTIVPSGNRSRLIYVTPSHQFPFGARMPLARRLVLLEQAGKAGAVVLEDDYDSEFLFEGRPVAALYGLAEEGRVVYMSTFSKSLMPGLRIAYCVVPECLAERLSQGVRNMGCAANVQTQAALAHFMDSGGYRKHLKTIMQIYLERGSALVAALKNRLGDRISVEAPAGNVQVTLAFRQPVDDVAISAAMHRHGFSVSPLSSYYVGENAKPGLVIGFAGASMKEIETGVQTLARLLDDAERTSKAAFVERRPG